MDMDTRRKGILSRLATIGVVGCLISSLLVPAAAFAASSTDTQQEQGTTTSNNQAPPSMGQQDSSGNMTPPDFQSEGAMGQPGGGTNGMLLGAGIALIALGIGFAGGFFTGRAIGKRDSSKKPSPLVTSGASPLPSTEATPSGSASAVSPPQASGKAAQAHN